MRALERDINLVFIRGKKYLALLGIYLALIILLSIGNNPNGQGPLSTMIEAVFRDSGNIIDFRDFTFPISFIVIHFLPVFALSEIFYRDNINFGSYLIGKFPSKRLYLANKFFASLVINLVIGFFFFASLNLFVSLLGESDGRLMRGFIRVGIFYSLENVLFTNFTLLISLFLGLRLALSIFMANLVLAMVTNFPLILGQGSLVMKQDFYGGFFSLGLNTRVLVIYMIIFLLLAYKLPRRYDYYGRKR
ncbi:MAG: hypothetical protein Q4D88_03425 [Anaerococcus sp.]|nr:hypothetical protein [Anaerococcus sp.]